MNEVFRYILFGSSEGWDGTPDAELARAGSLQELIDVARRCNFPYNVVIDRHDPRLPILLDSEHDFRPFLPAH